MPKYTLPKELNTCQYLADGSVCTRPEPNPCGMLEKQPFPKNKNTYVRKERWYEKCYKGSK